MHSSMVISWWLRRWPSRVHQWSWRLWPVDELWVWRQRHGLELEAHRPGGTVTGMCVWRWPSRFFAAGGPSRSRAVRPTNKRACGSRFVVSRRISQRTLHRDFECGLRPWCMLRACYWPVCWYCRTCISQSGWMGSRAWLRRPVISRIISLILSTTHLASALCYWCGAVLSPPECEACVIGGERISARSLPLRDSSALRRRWPETTFSAGKASGCPVFKPQHAMNACDRGWWRYYERYSRILSEIEQEWRTRSKQSRRDWPHSHQRRPRLWHTKLRPWQPGTSPPVQM